MTDMQFTKIIEMVRMIIENCRDLEEAKEKLARLADDDSQKAVDN